MGAPQTRLSELAQQLVLLGWEVQVLTAVPNYPTGKIFKGYKKGRVVKEDIEGISVIRVPIFPAQRGIIRRIISYVSFIVSICYFGVANIVRPTLFWVESPPIFIGLAALRMKRYFNCPYIFNVSDLWPESAIRMGMIKPGLLAKAIERFELFIYDEAAGITGQSCEIIESITKRRRLIKAELITNGVRTERFIKENINLHAREILGPEPGPIFIYAGLLGIAQGLDILIDLAASLRSDIPGRIVIVGDGPERKRLLNQCQGTSRIRILPAQPRECIPSLLACADVAIIPLGQKLPGAVPSKIYEAMASSIPILLIADGEARQRVLQAQAGLVVSPGDLNGLRRSYAVLASDSQLRKKLGENGLKSALNLYDRKKIAVILDIYLRSFINT
jgi:glycosyltransferase involved in cell wall biosynthesis